MVVGPAKVLILFGSEGGASKRGIESLAKKWTAESGGKFTIAKIAEGNTFANEEDFASLAENYQVLLVATSSYGEGDPPDNISLFVLSLLRASKANSRPLAGLQHAVLGYGESVYDTFQNCPRLVDKLLGECGSRRLLQRVEIDGAEDYDGAEDPPEKHLKRFESDVLKVLRDLPQASTPPVCDWTSPKSKLLEKSERELGSTLGLPESTGSAVYGVAAVVAMAGAAYAAWSAGLL